MKCCPICSNEMIDAQATDFGPSYKYCRTCKKELSEMGQTTAPAGCAFNCDEAEGIVSARCSIHGSGPVPEEESATQHRIDPGPCHVAANCKTTHRYASNAPGTRCGCHAFERDYRGTPRPSEELDPAHPNYVLPSGAFSMSAGYNAGKVHVGNPYEHAGKKIWETPFEGFNFRGTRSGRFSSKAPNLSNLPKNGLEARRQYGKITKGNKFITAQFPGADGIGADVIHADNMAQLAKAFANRTRAYEEQWLKDGGWVQDQGYWAPTKDGQVCFFHMKKIEDALAMEKWRRMGADNHDAMMCVDRFSWEDDAMVERRLSAGRREMLQRTWRARYAKQKAQKFGEAYGMGPNEIFGHLVPNGNMLKQAEKAREAMEKFKLDYSKIEQFAVVKIHNEYVMDYETSESGAKDAEAICKTMEELKRFAEENQVAVMLGAQPPHDLGGSDDDDYEDDLEDAADSEEPPPDSL